jgi:hypothetical protein
MSGQLINKAIVTLIIELAFYALVQETNKLLLLELDFGREARRNW